MVKLSAHMLDCNDQPVVCDNGPDKKVLPASDAPLPHKKAFCRAGVCRAGESRLQE